MMRIPNWTRLSSEYDFNIYIALGYYTLRHTTAITVCTNPLQPSPFEAFPDGHGRG